MPYGSEQDKEGKRQLIEKEIVQCVVHRNIRENIAAGFDLSMDCVAAPLVSSYIRNDQILREMSIWYLLRISPG